MVKRILFFISYKLSEYIYKNQIKTSVFTDTVFFYQFVKVFW
jgi:hypothetical protein